MLEVTLSFRDWKALNVPARARSWMFGDANCRYRLIAMIMGTVITSDKVEGSSAEADSASMVLYLAASRTTIVARGKLQMPRPRENRNRHG
jgi:hypothetical protein